nr:hypothetical protein CR513_00322 [Ipomoea batatas]
MRRPARRYGHAVAFVAAAQSMLARVTGLPWYANPLFSMLNWCSSSSPTSSCKARYRRSPIYHNQEAGVTVRLRMVVVSGGYGGLRFGVAVLRLPADNRPLLLRRTSAPGEITELNHHQNILRKIRFHAVLNKPIAFQGVERRRLFCERGDEVVDAQLSGGPDCADAVPAGVAQSSHGIHIWLFAWAVVLQRDMGRRDNGTYGFELAKAQRIREELFHLSSSRMMHPRGSIHVLDPTGLTRRQNPVQLRHVQRRRLLHQHVLLLLRRQDGPLHVEAGGESDVNGVHVRIIQHGVVAAVKFRGGRALVLGGKRRSLLRRVAAHGGDGRVWSQRYSPGQLARYGDTAQYSETDLPLLCHFFRRTPRRRLQRAQSSCLL